MQVLVDISTQAEVFERVDAAVTAHLAANSSEFTGKHLVVANFASDPLKFTLCVWYEYTHTGMSPASTYAHYCLSLNALGLL